MKYHYTVGDRFFQIEESGHIKVATAGLELVKHLGRPMRERPAAWFTTSEEWEQSANKGIVEHGVRRSLSQEETARLAGGLWRIAVRDEAAPVSWAEHVAHGGIDPEWVEAFDRLYQTGAHGNPADWWLSYTPVTRHDWLHADYFFAGQWRRYAGLPTVVEPRFLDIDRGYGYGKSGGTP